METKIYDVVGIGNAIVDFLAHIEEEVLEHHNLEKGIMMLIDQDIADQFTFFQAQKVCSGGSVANSMVYLSMLGVRSAFIGNVGNDKYAKIFTNSLKQEGVEFFPQIGNRSYATAKSFVFVTPDAERTMLTFLGEAGNLRSQDINFEVIRKSKFLYIEGYLWDRYETLETLKRAIKTALNNDTKIILSLSDPDCVKRNIVEILKFIESSEIDILIGNEVEFKSLFSVSDFEGVLEEVAKLNMRLENQMITAVTRNKNGCAIFQGETMEYVDSLPIKKIVDSTGAGDAFAAGFIYGVINGISLKDSGLMGNLLAANAIQNLGARLVNE